MWPFIAGNPGEYTRHFGNYSWEEGSAWGNAVKVGGAETTSNVWFNVEYFCNTEVYLCREELRMFDRALFDSLGRVANVSLEKDMCKQAGFAVSFGGLGCKRAVDIALLSSFTSMNSVPSWKLLFLELI